MNKLTKEQYEFCNTHLKTIEQIVVTSACSNIPPDYLDGLRAINKEYKYTQCVTCNSSIFLATNRLYKDYLFTKEQITEENERERIKRKRDSKEKGQKRNDRKDKSVSGESN